MNNHRRADERTLEIQYIRQLVQ